MGKCLVTIHGTDLWFLINTLGLVFELLHLEDFRICGCFIHALDMFILNVSGFTFEI